MLPSKKQSPTASASLFSSTSTSELVATGTKIKESDDAVEQANNQFEKNFSFANNCCPTGKIPEICKSAKFQIDQIQTNGLFWWKERPGKLDDLNLFDWTFLKALDLSIRHDDDMNQKSMK